jgi:nucleotide-binding universal stress UspA family protein
METSGYPPRRILVPVDFGAASAKALSAGAALAREFGATLEVLHVEVLDAPPYFTHDQVNALQAQRRQARANAERYLRRFAEQHQAGDATVVIADGPAGDVILAHAGDADLVVMGTNDRGKAARFWMGSVAERVSREATVPVLVVHATDNRSVQDYAKELAEEARRRNNG